jgi:SAM-dependent methyltransferase
MAVARNPSLTVDMLNPDVNDLAATMSLAQLFEVESRCRFHSNLVEAAPFAPNSFEIITSISVIEHIPDDIGAIRRLWDLLRPGGRLLISVPCAAKAMEEYTNLDEYKLLGADDRGFVFWQRYYDQALLDQRIFPITGTPRRSQIYGEKMPNTYDANVMEKRTNPYYAYWREPFMMGVEYAYFDHISELPGMGVIAMEFVKPL